MSPMPTIQTRFSWRPMMEAVPIQNIAARVERLPDGTLKAYVKKLRPWYMKPPLSWMMQPRSERCLLLDRLGTEVWVLCDGTRKVEEVVDLFANRHSLSFHEARAAVTAYLKMLIQPGVLAIAMKKGDQ
jgi:Coenzyme PQQ synthesis protein D (PqqD)